MTVVRFCNTDSYSPTLPQLPRVAQYLQRNNPAPLINHSDQVFVFFWWTDLENALWVGQSGVEVQLEVQ